MPLSRRDLRRRLLARNPDLVWQAFKAIFLTALIALIMALVVILLLKYLGVLNG